MFQVNIEGFTVFEGPVVRLGGGGTKTAYQLVGTDFVVLLPNSVDGQALVNIFDRICDDEIYFYNYLTTHELLGLPVLRCSVKTERETFSGLYAPAFSAYANHQAHVIDKKNIFQCHLDLTQLLPQSVQEWIPVFQPLIQDLKRLTDNKVCPWGDSYNFLWTERGSQYHSGSAPYALRYFGFDFSNKHFSRCALQPIENKQRVIQIALQEAVDIVFLVLKGAVSEEVSSELKAALCECELEAL
jgi:hypothetical protein